MSEVNLISRYDFNLGGAIIELGFTENNHIYTKMMMMKKTAPLESISTIIVKKAALASKLQYDIKITRPNGKEQIFQSVQIDNADPMAKAFAEELKIRVPASCKWIDKLEKIKVKEDISGKKKYDLQIMWFLKGKLFAGQGRIFQIIMNYGMLSIAGMGLPFPLLIYVLATGCHRVITDQQGITIRKLSSRFFSWDEVERIEVGKYNIIITNYGTEQDSIFLIRFQLIAKNGMKSKFTIRSLEGKQFVQEMIELGKIDPGMEEAFA